MKIKYFLEYSKYLDLVEGYEDLGSLGRSNKLVGQAMVFLNRDLYAFIDAIEKLLNCGFIVIAMICDQDKNNVAALVKVLEMKKEKPFVEVKGQKIRITI